MMERPNPNELLAEVSAADGQRVRGKLKVYFGYAAGVGKTYAMLESARRLQAEGADLVVGYVEPHDRPETEALLEGLEALPPLLVPHRGVSVREFDLDAALVRRPQVLLVDELAHSNARELRHAKRWQDVEELLDAGIDVWTTCNVQHIESLNDVVAQISGIVMRETVPDDFFARAQEVALIDLPPEDLLDRLKQGKVYLPEEAERALRGFFKKGTLTALREMALRRTAERIHVDVERARQIRGDQRSWATRESLLVCVGPSPTSANVIRSAKRLARSMQAELVAVHVENAGSKQLDSAERAQLLANLKLATRLGAETVTLAGIDPVAETLEYAQRRNVTKIIIGKSKPASGWFGHKDSLSDRLIRDSGHIDVVVVRGVGESLPPVSLSLPPQSSSLAAWLFTAATLVFCTIASWVWHFFDFTEANLVMTYLAGVVFISFRFGLWPSVVASVAAVLLFDVFFTLPHYTVAVHDSQYLVTFAVMLVVALSIVALSNRVKSQANLSKRNERRTEALYRLSRKLNGIMGSEFLIAEAERTVAQVFGGEVAILLPKDGRLLPVFGHEASFVSNPNEIAVAEWVLHHDQIAGAGTDTLPAAQGLYCPLSSPHQTVGVLAIRHRDVEELVLPEPRSLLEAFTTMIALALERDRLTLDNQAAQVKAETEELRSTLLASISHDIRTPLAVIAGASSSLMQEQTRPIDPKTRQDLLATMMEESDRLTRLVDNLLRLTQLSSGRVQIEKEWHPLEEVIGSALRAVDSLLVGREVCIHLPDGLPMGHFDAILIHQLLVNLLQNAARYTPEGSPIEINGANEGEITVIEVADRGPGISPSELETVFQTFERGRAQRSDSRGSGLGLAICSVIAKVHGGKISARTRDAGGTVFRLQLPGGGAPPPRESPDEEAEDP